MKTTETQLKRLSLHKQTLCLMETPEAQREVGAQAYTRVVCHSYVGC